MSTRRQEMINEVIRSYGLNDTRTRKFIELCRSYAPSTFNDDRLAGVVAKYQTEEWWNSAVID